MAGDFGLRLFLGNSGIHGQGIFAGEFIPKGSRVIRVQGILKHRDEVVEGMRALQIGPETYLAEDPENPGMDDLINHSCDPNLGFLNGSLVLYAIRDIHVDEELFWDYSTSINEEGWEVECGCRSELCRGKIQSYCDLRQHDRARLKDFVLEYLR